MKTVRRPPYPKWNPGYFPCSSLTTLPLSSRRPSVSFGGFGLKDELHLQPRHTHSRAGRSGAASGPKLRTLGAPLGCVGPTLETRYSCLAGPSGSARCMVTGKVRRGVGDNVEEGEVRGEGRLDEEVRTLKRRRPPGNPCRGGLLRAETTRFRWACGRWACGRLAYRRRSR